MPGLLTHLNTRLKLFEKVSLLLVIMVLVASVNIGVIYTYHQQAEQVGNSVNIAGQERMLSQRMARLATEVYQGENPGVARNQLRVASERFEQNLDALESGGTVPDQSLNPGADTEIGEPRLILRGEKLDPAPKALEPELSALRASWDEYQDHVETILTADVESTAFAESLAYVTAESDTLLSQSDTVTAEFAVVLREHRALLERVLWVLLAVDLVVALLGAFAARRYIGLPMADIARIGRQLARGETAAVDDVGLPIDSQLPDHEQRSELAQLSHSFAAVQTYLETASKQAQALARRDFDDQILHERIPGELGQSLDEMQTDLPSYIEELRTTTEKLEALIRASPAGILITGPNGQVKRWNPAAEEIFGWPADQVEGKANPAVPEAQQEAFRDLLSDAIVNGAVSGEERQWQTKSGETVDISLSVAPVPGGDDTLEGVMIVVEDITDRKERERTLEQQRDELETLNQVTELVLTITEELVESSNQDRIETTVCTSLLDSSLYETAWILGRDTDGTLAVRTAPHTSMVSEDSRLDASHRVYDAVTTAFEEGTVRLETDVADSLLHDNTSPDERRAVAAIPLAYRETVFGVLLVMTDRTLGFSDRELSGLATLGNTVGFAIDAITDKKLLFADTVVELTFEVSETPFPFVETSNVCDCHLWFDGLVAGTEQDTIDVYLGVEGADVEDVIDTLVAESEVINATGIATEAEPYRVKVTLKEGSLIHPLVRRQGRIHAIELDRGKGTYTLEVPQNADIERTVDRVQSADDHADFVAKTEEERQAVLGTETGLSVREILTERQYEVLKTAYFAGYFEWPRQSTIEDVATDLDLAGSTVNHHLRHAQQKVAERIFDPATSKQ